MKTLVWAFKSLPELGGKTGFVHCEAELAKKLIERGDAQDARTSPHKLKHIERSAGYDTKVMVARSAKRKKAA